MIKWNIIIQSPLDISTSFQAGSSKAIIVSSLPAMLNGHCLYDHKP